MLKKNSSKFLDQSIFCIYIIFFLSIICSFRGITSIAIGLILITGIIKNRKDTGFFLNKNVFSAFLVGCTLLFLVKCFSLLYTDNVTEGLNHLRKTSSLIILPLAIYSSSRFLNTAVYRNLMTFFILILSLACLYCLSFSFIKYSQGSPSSVFFYHDLVKPLHQHAIQFSILIFIGLIFLFEGLKNQLITIKKPFCFGLIIFLSLFLLLLSSKLILVFYFIYVSFYFVNIKVAGKKKRLLFLIIPLVLAGLLLITSNPVGNRFRELVSGDAILFKQEKFNQGTYFNGIQFRLLQWRFVYEVLNEQDRWMSGLSPGDAQTYLDQKYIITDMYTGKPGSTDRGYLTYHTHNQFLQVLLQTGLAGLIIFLFICCSLIRMTIRCRNTELRLIVIVLLVYSFTDAVLETQYGLVLFLFFPVFTYLGNRKE